jgi:hypothetical protein
MLVAHMVAIGRSESERALLRRLRLNTHIDVIFGSDGLQQPGSYARRRRGALRWSRTSPIKDAYQKNPGCP